MQVPVPLGDVVDRITILRLKVSRLEDPAASAAAAQDLAVLEDLWQAAGHPAVAEFEELGRVNGRLWDVEDQLRRHEAARDFGPHFIARARSVYLLNDQRARLKHAVNERLGSELVEQKQYVKY